MSNFYELECADGSGALCINFGKVFFFCGSPDNDNRTSVLGFNSYDDLQLSVRARPEEIRSYLEAPPRLWEEQSFIALTTIPFDSRFGHSRQQTCYVDQQEITYIEQTPSGCRVHLAVPLRFPPSSEIGHAYTPAGILNCLDDYDALKQSLITGNSYPQLGLQQDGHPPSYDYDI